MRSKSYHIAHVLPFPALGGVEVAALRSMQGLAAVDIRSTAFCLTSAAMLTGELGAAGIETALYQGIEPSYRHPRAFLRNAFQLAREFRRRNVDLVHCQDVLAAYYAALAGKLAGLPVLCHVRSQRTELTRRERSFLLAVDHFAFVSRNTWESFAHPVKASRGTVLYDGFDFVEINNQEARQSVCREFDLPTEVKLIGMVARVARQKDYATLVRAAARVVAVAPETRFLVIGDHSSQPDYRAHYQEVQTQIDAAGLTNHFIFTGHRADVLRLLATVDVALLCTHTEGFPLSVLEAMGQGKPVVATAVGGVPEFVINGETGLLHKHQDDAELATKLLLLLRDRALAARLGETGREFVQANFNRQRSVTALTELYHTLLVGRAAKIVAQPAEVAPHPSALSGGNRATSAGCATDFIGGD